MKTVLKLLFVANILFLSLELQTTNLRAQDIHFSQFRMTPLYIDPSQAGKFSGDHRAIINYRDQWSSVTISPFRTYGASYDTHFNKNGKKDSFLGGGICAYADKAGEIGLRNTIINIAIAYHVRINQESYLSAGLQGGITQTTLSLTNLQFDNQFDDQGYNSNLPSNESFQNISLVNPDFAIGLSYSFGTNTSAKVVSNNGYDGTKVNIGAAMHHVSSPDYSFIEQNADNMNFKYILYTNTSFGFGGTNIAIQPSGFIAYQGKSTDILIGSFFRFSLREKSKFTQYSKGTALSIGTHLRIGDAFVPSVLIETSILALGLSYDINVSGLSTASNGQGGLELSLRFVLPNPSGSRKSQPRFF